MDTAIQKPRASLLVKLLNYLLYLPCFGFTFYLSILGSTAKISVFDQKQWIDLSMKTGIIQEYLMFRSPLIFLYLIIAALIYIFKFGKRTNIGNSQQKPLFTPYLPSSIYNFLFQYPLLTAIIVCILITIFSLSIAGYIVIAYHLLK